jgi:uncharacterized protein YgbK (DUF1537 family)
MSDELGVATSSLITRHSSLGLIADDLTGALDAGAGFVRHGLRAVLPFSGRPEDAPDADVILVNTETRDQPDGPTARRQAFEAAQRLASAGIGHVYKKIDSVLRGHPGAELAGVLDVFGGRALVAPAFPAQGRTTVHGQQLLHGRPVERFGGHLRAALGDALPRCDLRDAASDDDLALIAREAARQGYRVWCGTAGLASHVPGALQLQPAHGRPPSLPSVERVLVFVGTTHPATNAQLDRLHEAAPPQARVLVEGRDYPNGPAVAAALQRAAKALQHAARVSQLGAGTGLILTGGETALIVCRALHAQSVEVLGEALPGIPMGVLRLPTSNVAIATKSGGFGSPDALLHTVEALTSPRPPLTSPRPPPTSPRPPLTPLPPERG